MQIHSDHLKIHMKTHDNQKPFQCTVCNRGYSTAAALTSHMQNHHKRAAERANSPQISGPSYKCLQCTQIFRKPDELQVGTHEMHLFFPPSFHPADIKRVIHSPATFIQRCLLTCLFATTQINRGIRTHTHTTPVNPFIPVCDFRNGFSITLGITPLVS